MLVGADGGVLCFGSAPFLGAPAPGAAVTAIAPTPGGYLILRESAEVEAFGTAASLGLPSCDARAVDLASTFDGTGYWVLDEAGGIFTFGTATFFGSRPGLGVAHAPAVALAPTPSGRGYWIIDAAGGVFAFGDAGYFGSLPERGVAPNGQAVDLAALRGGNGYLILDQGGVVHAFGNEAGPERQFRPYDDVTNAVALLERSGALAIVDERGLVYPCGPMAFVGSAAGLELAAPICDAAFCL